jgi:hypothetical protein
MTIAVAYHVETALWSVATLTFLILFSGLVLAMRFTPAKKRSDAKVGVLVCAYISVLIDVPRCFDLSAVYGNIGLPTAGFLHGLVTSVQLYALALFIRSLARTLYTQMQQPVPRIYSISLLAATTMYLLATIVLNSLIYSPYNDRDYSALSLISGIKGAFFDASILCLTVIELVLFFRLRWRLQHFIATVETQHRNITGSTKAAAPAVPASPKELERKLTVETTKSSSGNRPTHAHAMSDSNITPLPAASPMSVELRGMSSPLTVQPASDAAAEQQASPEVLVRVRSEFERRDSESAFEASTQPLAPCNPSPMLTAVQSQTPAARTATVQPQVVEVKVRVMTVPVVVAPVQSSHEQRVQELKNAVRTLTTLSVIMVLILGLCVGIDIGDLTKMINGEQLDEHQVLGQDPESYSLTHNLMPLVQQINLTIIAWFCWSPWLFLPRYLKERNQRFWDVLLHGLDAVAATASRYETIAGDASGNKSPNAASGRSSQITRQNTRGGLGPAAAPASKSSVAPSSSPNPSPPPMKPSGKQAWIGSGAPAAAGGNHSGMMEPASPMVVEEERDFSDEEK